MKEPVKKKVTIDYAKIVMFVKSLNAVGTNISETLPAMLPITKTNDKTNLNQYLSVNVKSNVNLLTIKARNNAKIDHTSTITIPLNVLTEKVLSDSIDLVINAVGVDKDKIVSTFILDHFLK